MRRPPDQDDVALSVVVPARNERDRLAGQLDALTGQEWDGTWEVVVVDNGSTDGTDRLVEEYVARDARVRLVRAPDAVGAAAVRNAGVAERDGAPAAVSDADDLVDPGWLRAMGGALAEHAFVAGPLDVESLNPAWLVHTRGVPSRDSPMTFHGAFPQAPAGNLGMHRDVWDRLGGLDPAMVSHEDAELSLRAKLAGVRLQFRREAVVRYRYRTEPRALFRQGLAYGRYRPIVVRRARAAGLPVPRLSGWRSWTLLVLWLPRVRTREGRAAYAWVAGVRLGLLRGALRHRVFYL